MNPEKVGLLGMGKAFYSIVFIYTDIYIKNKVSKTISQRKNVFLPVALPSLIQSRLKRLFPRTSNSLKVFFKNQIL